MSVPLLHVTLINSFHEQVYGFQRTPTSFICVFSCSHSLLGQIVHYAILNCILYVWIKKLLALGSLYVYKVSIQSLLKQYLRVVHIQFSCRYCFTAVPCSMPLNSDVIDIHVQEFCCYQEVWQYFLVRDGTVSKWQPVDKVGAAS